MKFKSRRVPKQSCESVPKGGVRQGVPNNLRGASTSEIRDENLFAKFE